MSKCAVRLARLEAAAAHVALSLQIAALASSIAAIVRGDPSLLYVGLWLFFATLSASFTACFLDFACQLLSEPQERP